MQVLFLNNTHNYLIIMLEVLRLNNYEDMRMDVGLFVYPVLFHYNLLLLLHMTMLGKMGVLLLLMHVL